MSEHSQRDFIRLEDLSKSYREGARTRVVLHQANAGFARGESVAILGRSGTGKSTLLNLIGGIDLVDGGAIWLDGQNLTSLDERRRTLFRRQNVGFVFQFFNLIPTLTVWENVVLPLELKGLNGKESQPRVEYLLEAVGLLDRRKTFPDRLSGGEQQRVAVARALVHDPFLVLADEPTGNLDEETGHQILTLLDRLTRQAGKNMILVTHSADAVEHADRVLHLRNGQLVEEPGS
ncbi:MAG: ABC transporter ATP-binding protein [Chloroflexota bacterium]|nr:MAG: ABC transporter ATP-binding protein [Chloroflexota bacterium]